MSRRARILVGAVIGLVVTACGGAAVASGQATPGANDDAAAAAAYCTEQGGEVVERRATWNTNGDEARWVPLANTIALCEFEMGDGDETTRISVDLETLYATEPTLAALAYLSKVTPPQTPQVGRIPVATTAPRASTARRISAIPPREGAG